MAGGAAVIETIAALAELRAAGPRARDRRGDREHGQRRRGQAGRHRHRARRHDDRDQQHRRRGPAGARPTASPTPAAEGCDAIVDIATLTGGVVVALGVVYAGLMANDDALAARADRVRASAPASACGGCRCTRSTPRWSRAATPQITNLTERREASAITAAEFLHHFAGDVAWAHLDIAAVGDDGRAPYLDKGGTGFGVRLLRRDGGGVRGCGNAVRRRPPSRCWRPPRCSRRRWLHRPPALPPLPPLPDHRRRRTCTVCGR